MSIIEFRQYTLHPGKRDVLIELFEREFIEAQEDAGMTVLGSFRDLERPDRFVFLRSFPDMPARRAALEAFYDRGVVWKANRDAANATLIDSDNVLLLRTVGGPPHLRPRPEKGTSALPASLFVASIYSRDSAFVDTKVAPSSRLVALFSTEYSENNYPRLPTRTGEHVVVTLCRFEDLADYRMHLQELPALGRVAATPEHLILAPTARSSLR
jgi:hypothetical protein